NGLAASTAGFMRWFEVQEVGRTPNHPLLQTQPAMLVPPTHSCPARAGQVSLVDYEAERESRDQTTSWTFFRAVVPSQALRDNSDALVFTKARGQNNVHRCKLRFEVRRSPGHLQRSAPSRLAWILC